MSNSAIIEKHVEQLQAIGWNIELHCSNIPEFTAYVDYDQKKLWINNSSAFYTSEFFTRIVSVVQDDITPNTNHTEQNRAVGMYQYQWQSGEKMVYVEPSDPEHTEFHYLNMIIMPVTNPMSVSQIYRLVGTPDPEPIAVLQEVE